MGRVIGRGLGTRGGVFTESTVECLFVLFLVTFPVGENSPVLKANLSEASGQNMFFKFRFFFFWVRVQGFF